MRWVLYREENGIVMVLYDYRSLNFVTTTGGCTNEMAGYT